MIKEQDNSQAHLLNTWSHKRAGPPPCQPIQMTERWGGALPLLGLSGPCHGATLPTRKTWTPSSKKKRADHLQPEPRPPNSSRQVRFRQRGVFECVVLTLSPPSLLLQLHPTALHWVPRGVAFLRPRMPRYRFVDVSEISTRAVFSSLSFSPVVCVLSASSLLLLSWKQ